MPYRVGEYVPRDRAEMGESTLPLELFRSFLNLKQPRIPLFSLKFVDNTLKEKKITVVIFVDGQVVPGKKTANCGANQSLLLSTTSLCEFLLIFLLLVCFQVARF